MHTSATSTLLVTIPEDESLNYNSSNEDEEEEEEEDCYSIATTTSPIAWVAILRDGVLLTDVGEEHVPAAVLETAQEILQDALHGAGGATASSAKKEQQRKQQHTNEDDDDDNCGENVASSSTVVTPTADSTSSIWHVTKNTIIATTTDTNQPQPQHPFRGLRLSLRDWHGPTKNNTKRIHCAQNNGTTTTATATASDHSSSNDGNSSAVGAWSFCAVYNATLVLQRDVREFVLRELVQSTVQFRRYDRTWRTGGHHACQFLFAPLLQRKLERYADAHCGGGGDDDDNATSATTATATKQHFDELMDGNHQDDTEATMDDSSEENNYGDDDDGVLEPTADIAKLLTTLNMEDDYDTKEYFGKNEGIVHQGCVSDAKPETIMESEMVQEKCKSRIQFQEDIIATTKRMAENAEFVLNRPWHGQDLGNVSLPFRSKADPSEQHAVDSPSVYELAENRTPIVLLEPESHETKSDDSDYGTHGIAELAPARTIPEVAQAELAITDGPSTLMELECSVNTALASVKSEQTMLWDDDVVTVLKQMRSTSLPVQQIDQVRTNATLVSELTPMMMMNTTTGQQSDVVSTNAPETLRPAIEPAPVNSIDVEPPPMNGQPRTAYDACKGTAWSAAVNAVNNSVESPVSVVECSTEQERQGETKRDALVDSECNSNSDLSPIASEIGSHQSLPLMGAESNESNCFLTDLTASANDDREDSWESITPPLQPFHVEDGKGREMEKAEYYDDEQESHEKLLLVGHPRDDKDEESPDLCLWFRVFQPKPSALI